MRYMHSCTATEPIPRNRECCINLLIEAMHLLPQSFVFQATHSSSQGSLREQRHSSSQSLFGFSGKACRTSSRGRLFRLFPQDRNLHKAFHVRPHIGCHRSMMAGCTGTRVIRRFDRPAPQCRWPKNPHHRTIASLHRDRHSGLAAIAARSCPQETRTRPLTD